jgi:hypothetical protein
MLHEVFISYSQADRDCAYELVARIEAEGIYCWVAPRDIAPSADWAAEIIGAISQARMMILVFSASSNESPQVRREVERAAHKELNILPFRIENVLPSKSLEYFLSTQHWMDAFPPPRETHYAKLCAYLRTQLAPRAAPLAPTVNLATARATWQPLDPAELQQVERTLAGYLGPVAKHLVKSTALRAAGIEDLITQLAMELDKDSERREFMQRCRLTKPHP